MVDRFVDKDQAVAYSKYRTAFSNEALDLTLKYLREKINEPLTRALDVGCGTGVSTYVFAPYFKEVVGVDVSEAQLQQARKDPRKPDNVTFRQSEAEKIPLEDGSVQLVMTSHALHWFNLGIFFPMIKRIMVPNGVLAVWRDTVIRIIHPNQTAADEITELYRKFRYETAINYWDKRNFLSSNLYREVEFPFKDIVRNEEMIHYNEMTVGECLGWFYSWSAYTKMLQQEPQVATEALTHMHKRAAELLGSIDEKIKVEMSGVLITCRN